MLRRVVVNGLAIMRRTKMRRTDPGGITSNQILGIFGTGYAGLVTSVCFAELGHTVTAIDKDHDVVARLLDGYKLIVEKSTVPARTAYWVDWTIRRLAGPNHEFDVASNPEFLREGTAVQDFLKPDRIVIGA